MKNRQSFTQNISNYFNDRQSKKSYNERFDLIYNRFLKIWGYPDIEVPVYDDNEEQNIFNAESPTHKKLEYFIFENDKIEERDIADMYYLVIKKLFENAKRQPHFWGKGFEELIDTGRPSDLGHGR